MQGFIVILEGMEGKELERIHIRFEEGLCFFMSFSAMGSKKYVNGRFLETWYQMEHELLTHTIPQEIFDFS